MLDVNLSGAFHLCQLALPGMIRRKAGRILTVSSMWAVSYTHLHWKSALPQSSIPIRAG